MLDRRSHDTTGGNAHEDRDFAVNGKKVNAVDVEPSLLLSDFLRENARSDRHACRLRHQRNAAPASSTSTASR